MKKIVILLVLIGCIAYAAVAQAAKGGTLYTATKSLELKASTGFFAKTNGKLAYGDQVTVLQVNGKWVEVRSVSNSSVSGWSAAANFSARRISSTGSSGTASASEVALAGKGFNQEVESSYRSNNQLNYADVDKTEAITVPMEELRKFLTEGDLSTGE